MERLLVITNSGAGTADEATLEAALAVLRAEREVEVVATSSPEELDDVLADADGRTLVVVGGDGSLHAVVAALYRRSELAGTRIGLVPLGTGNDFARTQGLPLDAEEAARVVLSGTPAKVDLLVDDEGEVTANNVHVGAGAEAARVGARWKSRLGRVGYPIGALATALRPAGLRLRVTVDGEVVSDLRKVLMVDVGNGASVGGGAELAPGADPGDGLVDVVVSRSVGPLARFSYAVDVLRRRHPERDDVLRVRGREVTVESRDGEAWHLSSDGELSGPHLARTWRLVPGAYEMLLPQA